MGQARLMKLSVYRLSHFERAWQSQGGKKSRVSLSGRKGVSPQDFPNRLLALHGLVRWYLELESKQCFMHAHLHL